jgi:hypothetical protein
MFKWIDSKPGPSTTPANPQATKQDFLLSIINVAICRTRHAVTTHQDLALILSHPVVVRGQRRGRQRLHIAGRGEMIRGSRPRKADMPKYFGLEATRLFKFSCDHSLDTLGPLELAVFDRS